MARLGLAIAILVGCASASDSTFASGQQLWHRKGLLGHPAHHHHTGHHTKRQALHHHSLAAGRTSLPKTNLNKATAVTEVFHALPQAPQPKTFSQARQQAIPQELRVDALQPPTPTLVLNPAPTALSSSAASDGANAAVVQLGEELAEMEERRANVAQLEQALKADTALLRQSVSLERLSTSKHGRKAAARQARRAAQLVKDTEGMLHDSRAGVVEEARFMATEAEQATSAADALTAEASLELNLFGVAGGKVRDVTSYAAATPLTSTATSIGTDDAEDLGMATEK